MIFIETIDIDSLSMEILSLISISIRYISNAKNDFGNTWRSIMMNTFIDILILSTIKIDMIK